MKMKIHSLVVGMWGNKEVVDQEALSSAASVTKKHEAR